MLITAFVRTLGSSKKEILFSTVSIILFRARMRIYSSSLSSDIHNRYLPEIRNIPKTK